MPVKNNNALASTLLLVLSVAIPYAVHDVSPWFASVPVTLLLGSLFYCFKKINFRYKKTFLTVNLIVTAMAVYLSLVFPEEARGVSIGVVLMIAFLAATLNNHLLGKQ